MIRILTVPDDRPVKSPKNNKNNNIDTVNQLSFDSEISLGFVAGNI